MSALLISLFVCHKTTVFNECKLQRVVMQPVPGAAVGLRKIRQARIDRLLELFSCIVVVNLGSVFATVLFRE